MKVRAVMLAAAVLAVGAGSAHAACPWMDAKLAP